MADTWAQTALGDICRFQAGDAFGRDDQGRTVGDHPFIKVSDMNLVGNEIYISRANNWVSDEEAQQNYRLHPKNAVVFAKIGIALTYNRRRRLVRPTVIDNNMMSAVSAPNVDPVWFYYLLSTIDFNLISSGSALPYLTVKDLSKIPVNVPTLHEQQAIASVLGALDDKIELNRRMNETLEAMARAIFKDWFVDFGPTRAKMAMRGEDPQKEGTARAPYLTPDIWSLFPDRLDDEGKPEGWPLGSMSDLFLLQRGFDLPSQDRIDGPYPIVAASGPNGCHNAFMVKGPGVTTGRSGVLGNVFFVHQDFWPLNTSLWIKEFRRATPSYAYFYLQDVDFGTYNAGSAVPTLNRNHIHGLPTVLPHEALIKAFDDVALALLKRQECNRLESGTLSTTRDFLLPKLMSGEVRVSDAAALI